MALVPVMLYITLRTSRVQTWIAQRVASYLSQELGVKVSVGGVDISLFLNVVLEDIAIEDSQQNLLLYAGRLVFDIQKLNARDQSIEVKKLIFDRASVGLARYPGEIDYNFQFLVDYFGEPQASDTFELPRWKLNLHSFEFRESGLSMVDHNELHRQRGFDPYNFAFGDFNMVVEDLRYSSDTLWAQVRQFNVQESQGLHLEEFSGTMMISPQAMAADAMRIKTQSSDLEFDLRMQYEGYEAFRDFFHEVRLDIVIKPSKIGLYDFGYFIPGLYGMDATIRAEGRILGPLANIRGNDVLLSHGGFTRFRGNFSLSGLPVLEETFVNFSVVQFSTSKRDVERFRLPESSAFAGIKLPQNIENLGLVNFSGNFTGFINDFVAYGLLQSSIGRVSMDLAIRSNADFSNISYRGGISTRDFDLGQLIDITPRVGKVSLKAKVEGGGLDARSVDVNITGLIESMWVLDYHYRNIEVAGRFSDRRFNGSWSIDDPNLYADFKGLIDFREKQPLLNFSLQVDNANLTRLNVFQRDSLYESVLSTILTVNAKGLKLQDIEGELKIFSTVYQENPVNETEGLAQTRYHLGELVCRSQTLSESYKHLQLDSELGQLVAHGAIHYDYLWPSLEDLLKRFFPSSRPERIVPDRPMPAQQMDFNILVRENHPLVSLFLPELDVYRGGQINGVFDTSTQQFNLDAAFDALRIANTRFKKLDVKAYQQDERFFVTSQAQRLLLTDSLGMDQFFVSGEAFNDSLIFLMEWENTATRTKNAGHIEGLARLHGPRRFDLAFMPSYAYVNDSLWLIRDENLVAFDSAQVRVEGFKLSKNSELLKIDGVLSNAPEDQLKIELHNFNVDNLDFLLKGRKIDFAGIASGELLLSGLKQTPSILSNLRVRDFAFNHDHLGDLDLNSSWDALIRAFRVNVEIIHYGNIGYNKPIVAKGFIYPERKQDNFDIDIVIENLKMSIFSRYVDGFASNFRGLASGHLRLDGPLATPELSGKAYLARTGFRVDYLNTSYSFAHEVEVGKDFFRFDNLVLNDSLGNTGLASGIIRHDNFFNFSVDLVINPERMVVLNTLPHHNNLFYGRGFATGRAHIFGPVKNIVMNIRARANRGTQFFLPLEYTDVITESNFISFVSHQHADAPTRPQGVELSGFTMNFDLEVGPDAEVQMIFDSQIGDIIRGRGSGNLKFEINTQGAFNMYGDYTIEEGDYLFTLQNLINKRFRIEQGGTIRWTGDPYDADINIKAIYRLRTSMYDLVMGMDTSDVYRRRVPVETVLQLDNKLFNPNISFDIQIPGGDENIREMIQRLITTEQEMNRQVFSLLILNRFMPTTPDQYNTALGYGVGSTSTELLSNQLSNWLSQISNDFDIGINYRPGDEISSQELEIALSTQFFDDRVLVDGNFGVAGSNPATAQQRASNIIGDVNIEVKLTPEGKFRVKAFNRSNTFDVINTNSPYTQGVGLFYRKEFDSLSDLWKRSKRKPEELPHSEEVEEGEVETLQP